jgi:hypothetical protein
MGAATAAATEVASSVAREWAGADSLAKAGVTFCLVVCAWNEVSYSAERQSRDLGSGMFTTRTTGTVDTKSNRCSIEGSLLSTAKNVHRSIVTLHQSNNSATTYSYSAADLAQLS